MRVLNRSRRNGFDYDVTQNRLIIYGNQDTRMTGIDYGRKRLLLVASRCMIEGCLNGVSCNSSRIRNIDLFDHHVMAKECA